jgi:integrase
MRKKKPNKPSKTYPLFAHANGQWCKRIAGNQHYFGKWEDPQAALESFRSFVDKGSRRPVDDTRCKLSDFCNRFLTAKDSLVKSDELSIRSFRDYWRTCELMVEFFGRDRAVESITTGDLAEYRASLAKTRGLYALGNEISKARVVFNFGWHEDLLDKPVKFGTVYKRPSRKSMRIDRAKKQATNGKRMMEADQIRLMLDGGPENEIQPANAIIGAMVLIGVNGGLGPTDIANLPKSAIGGDWLNYPRPKTGISRRIPLWPETVKAINAVISARPAPNGKADAGLCFITKQGNRFVRTGPSGKSNIDQVGSEFNKLRSAEHGEYARRLHAVG